MKRQVGYFLTGMVITVLFVAFALGSDGILRPLAQISPLPTSTFTPIPSGPTLTSTPVPPTPTPTPADTKPPVSRVKYLKRVHFTLSFKVRWKGRDRGGSGIECYDVQYKDGSDAWQDWKICTTSTSAEFHGEWEHLYFFRARAMDNAGNVEAWPSKPDARTHVRREK